MFEKGQIKCGRSLDWNKLIYPEAASQCVLRVWEGRILGYVLWIVNQSLGKYTLGGKGWTLDQNLLRNLEESFGYLPITMAK